MLGRRARLAALTIGATSLFTLSSGIADASSGPTYRVSHRGPFATETICTTVSDSMNEPPDVYAFRCFYSETGVRGYKLLPGWYFRYQYRID
ncbi:hypothetical protein [Spongiactinospora sp. TRM90649]|uniref:hypothetical protein n=1 Tax=Spongiactinospora sp. TRM90649 TaxID=3031114 RepID=UPI0023F9F701|nr:hypothetical protein [Spongiactinospora sp. TRM90649]MDF5751865.1 hypothetical protein [Spongiactinospora sp. TRM90649]